MLSRDVPADSNQFYTRWCLLGYYYANSTCTSKWGILNQRCSVDSTATLTISLSVLVWALMQQECTSFLPSMPHRWSSRLTYFQSISFPIFKFMTESDTVHQSVHCDISSMCKGLYVYHWDCHNLSDYYNFMHYCVPIHYPICQGPQTRIVSKSFLPIKVEMTFLLLKSKNSYIDHKHNQLLRIFMFVIP